MSYLKAIKRLSATDNLGGVLSLRVARKADIISIPEPVAGVVNGDINFLPGRGWILWDVTRASADSTNKLSREGASKSNKLPFVIAKDRDDLLPMFRQAEDDEFIVLRKDASGKNKLFGLLYAPVRFRYDHTTGTENPDLNHFSCEFFYDGPDNVFDYDGSVPSAPAGPAPALVMYNGAVIAALEPGEVLNIISEFGFTDFYITA